jgi:hypothetical protein
VDIEVVRALDGWLAGRWEFGWRGYVGAEEGELGEDGPERLASSKLCTGCPPTAPCSSSVLGPIWHDMQGYLR